MATNYLTTAKVVSKFIFQLQLLQNQLFVIKVGITMLIIMFVFKVTLLSQLQLSVMTVTNYLTMVWVVYKFMSLLRLQAQNLLFVRKVGIMMLIIMFAFKVTLLNQLQLFVTMVTNYRTMVWVVYKLTYHRLQRHNRLFVKKDGIMTLIIMFAFRATLLHQHHLFVTTVTF